MTDGPLFRRQRSLLALLLACGAGQPASAAETNRPSVAPTNLALQAALAELARPSRHLLFRDVILATTGCRILPLDTNQPAHADLRRNILRAAALAAERLRAQGLAAARANEAGNHLEPVVRAALHESGLPARVPVNRAGRAQSTGYPDLEITAPLPCYLELKTYSAATANTTQRSFYYSPSPASKVTHDAFHLLLAYELEKTARDGQTVFLPSRWRLISLYDLEVDLKFEFNQSNRGMYHQPQAVLGEGELSEK
jgi:hypothetical protein